MKHAKLWIGFVLAVTILIGYRYFHRNAGLQSIAGEATALCLADPGGGLSLDEEIRRRQQQAKRLAVQVDGWVLVGRGWIRKARISADPGFYLSAEGCAQTALSIAPGHPAGLELRALAQMNGHRFAEAERTARDILSRDPVNVVALGALSDALLELGRFEEAATVAQRMMDARPDMASYSRAAYFRWLEGDSAHAKLFMRYALGGRDARDREPTAWSFVQAAAMFWSEGDYEGADAVYARALEWVAEYPPALIGRARVMLSLQQPRRAIEYLERAKRSTRLPELWWLLGDAHEMLGEHDAARDAYDHVVREGRQVDRLTLALFYATKNRDLEEALRLIQEERKIRGGPFVEDVHAWVLYRAGRIAEAQEIIDRATRLGTPDARLLYHAGAIRMAAGRHADGIALVKRALALNPHFDATGAGEARTLLELHDRADAAHGNGKDAPAGGAGSARAAATARRSPLDGARIVPTRSAASGRPAGPMHAPPQARQTSAIRENSVDR